MATFRDVSTNNSAGTSKVGLKPAGTQVGDVLYALVINDGGGTGVSITPPSGWTIYASTDQSTPDGNDQWFYRKDAAVVGGDPASWTWTVSTGNAGVVVVAAWSGASVATSPVVAARPLTSSAEAPYTSSNNTPISGTTTSGITVPSGDSFGLFVLYDQTVQTDTWTSSGYSNSLVERADYANSDWVSVALASIDGAAAGATGAVTFTGTRASGSGQSGYATILFSIPSAPPAGTLIQSTAETSGSGTSGSVTINGVAAGSTLVVQVGWDNSVAGLTGISDGTAYTSAIYLDDTANTAGGSVRYRQGVAAGNYTITASFGASASAIFMRAHEIGGVVQSGGLNQVAGQVQTSPGTGTDGISSGASAATTAANCFILGLSQNNVESPDGTGTLTAGTGYTLSGSIKHLAAEYKNVTSTGTQTATFTSTVNIARSTSVLAFEVAVAPVITVQPTNQSALIGQTATFSVTATGTGSLSYLWYKNTVTTGVTTSSYTTGTLASSDNGTLYYVDCINTNGTTTSNTVRLLVSSNGVGTLGMFDPEMRILGWF